MKKLLLLIVLILICTSFIFNGFSSKKEEPLKFASWGSQNEVEIINKLIKNYEKENNTKVEFLHIPQNYFQKIHLLFASNLAPDVIFLNNQNAKLYIEADLLEDLTPFFKEEQKEYYPQAIECFKHKNKLYAIPRDISNLVLYVNKDILKKQKVEYKRKINSLDELLEISTKLTTNEHFGINYETNPLFWSYYLCANGGGIISDDEKEISINKKESLEAIKFYTNLAHKHHVAPTKAEIGSLTTAQMFINGKLAMLLSGRWLVPKFKETLDFDWDIIEFPSSEEHKVYIDSSAWAISKNSKKKDEAIKFIKYISASSATEEFTKSGLIIPARKEIAEKYLKHSKLEKPNNEDLFIEMLQYTKPTPINKNHNKINDIIIEKMEAVLNAEKDANSAFDEKTIKKLEGLL